ncbi:F-box/LRR-repeat protein 3-like [Pyrus x bretschneideri]|uniref:F-box/LRR-repeat protein 3-like n=1 Tax=Pyrus x bretschneideri TaxID=225117 RepID=UPI0020308C06|nr:F-box/LRR-repeat protein 3-like [Pyrus x bretschneideri]
MGSMAGAKLALMKRAMGFVPAGFFFPFVGRPLQEACGAQRLRGGGSGGGEELGEAMSGELVAKKLRLSHLKWCLRVTNLGVGLLAVKCKDLRSLDLSYLPITDKCLPSIFELQYLEDLVLEGCFGIDDDSLSTFKHGCKSLKKLEISSCQDISHVGLSVLASCSEGCLEQLVLSYGSPVTLALADSLEKLPTLQSIKLDGCLVTCAGLKSIGKLVLP